MSDWYDTCGQCGCDLPIDAPATQRFCSPECREVAREPLRLKLQAERNVARRAERLALRQGRKCEECGSPLSGILSQRFCTDPCQRRNYQRRLAAAAREARLAARAQLRAERKAGNAKE